MDTRLEYIFLTMVLMTGGSQIATVTVSAVPLAQETPKCDLFLYYDHGTGTCEPCRGLCYAAAVQRTEDQCQALCSDYLMSLNCTDDQYYDDVVRECSPCSELCKDRSITGTAEQCTNKCRAYLDKLEKEREPPKIQSHDLQQVNMDKPADVDQPLEEEEEPQSGPLTPAGIAGVVVAGVVLLVIVVVVIVIMAKKRRQNRYMLTPQSDTGTKPVQATSPGPIPETDPQATGSPAYNPT